MNYTIALQYSWLRQCHLNAKMPFNSWFDGYQETLSLQLRARVIKMKSGRFVGES